MIRLLTILFVTTSGHGRGSDIYNSQHVDIDPIYTSEMELFKLKNRSQVEMCLRLLPEDKCLSFLFNADYFWL